MEGNFWKENEIKQTMDERTKYSEEAIWFLWSKGRKKNDEMSARTLKNEGREEGGEIARNKHIQKQNLSFTRLTHTRASIFDV